MNPTSSDIDITNQKLGAGGRRRTCRFRTIMVGTMPAIRRFIDSSSEVNVPASARR